MQSLPQCSRHNEPCDYALKTISQRRSPNGDVEREETLFETITEICTCPDGITCPRGWDNAPGRTITRNLLSSGKIFKEENKILRLRWMELIKI